MALCASRPKGRLSFCTDAKGTGRVSTPSPPRCRGFRGWMGVSEMAAPKKTAEKTVFEPKKVVCEGFSGLNVRKSPSMAAPIERVLDDGAEVSASEPRRGWIKLEDGGYVRSCYLA